mgnify:CR=1 FL=1
MALASPCQIVLKYPIVTSTGSPRDTRRARSTSTPHRISRRVVQPAGSRPGRPNVSLSLLEHGVRARGSSSLSIADGSRTIFLARAGRGQWRCEPVDVPGREHDDSTAAISRADRARGKMRVHGPRERFVAVVDPELPAGHEDHVRRDQAAARARGFVEQIAADRLDPARLQSSAAGPEMRSGRRR